MNPFSYSKAQHRRKLSPPSSTNYKSYKPFLQQEFGSRCVYCCLPDGMKGYESFGVDHYRPRKLFLHLATTYSNLFYSCNCCNSRKGDFWPSADQIRDNEFIPNPCDHVMFEHLQYKGAIVTVKTPAGRQAEKILDFNDPKSVEYRQFVLDTIAAMERNRRELVEQIKKIEALMELSPDHANELKNEKASAVDDLERTEKHLTRLCGQLFL